MQIPEAIEFDELFCKGADIYNKLEEQLEKVGIDPRILYEFYKAIQDDMIRVGFNLGYWYVKDQDKYNELIKEFSMLMKGEGAGSNE